MLLAEKFLLHKLNSSYNTLREKFQFKIIQTSIYGLGLFTLLGSGCLIVKSAKVRLQFSCKFCLNNNASLW